MKPEVSIITCSYNAEGYIEDTARSIGRQTFTNYEWLVIDDGSTDSSPGIIRELAARDKRIKPYLHRKNRGPVAVRNFGMERARGRFIAIVDSDDLWLPEKLEKQVAFMKENRIPLSYTAYKKIRKCGKLKSGLTVPVPEMVSYRRILKSDSIMASSAMYDTDITGPITQPFGAPVGKDDLFFFLMILRRHGPARGVRDDLARLRLHGDSITGNKLKAARRQWRFYRRVIGLSPLKAISYFFVYAVKGFIKYLL